jgi:hypothetical protein
MDLHPLKRMREMFHHHQMEKKDPELFRTQCVHVKMWWK